jgi:hypothetical protein
MKSKSHLCGTSARSSTIQKAFEYMKLRIFAGLAALRADDLKMD